MNRISACVSIGVLWFALHVSSTALAGSSAEVFFEGPGLSNVSISAGGEWIAARAESGPDSMVIVQRVGTPGMVAVAKAKILLGYSWESPQTLVVEMITRSGDYQAVFIRLFVSGGRIEADARRMAGPGRLIDSLPTIPNRVLWRFEGIDGWTSVHRISVDALVDYKRHIRIAGKVVDLGERVAVASGPSGYWVSQRDGRPRAGIRFGKAGFAVLMPAYGTGPFESVHWSGNNALEQFVKPVALTADESKLLVFAYNGRNTLGLHDWDDARRAPGKEVFVHPNYDLDHVLIDALTGDLVAAAYEEGGATRYHYFDDYRRQFLERLSPEWRKQSTAIVSSSRDRDAFVFLDSNETNPGDFYLRSSSGRVSRIGRFAENVDRTTLAPSESFRVASKGGVEIEAYLTRPRTPGRAPLVVMPHGGPAGVRDSRAYNPLVQYLASWGFAVLQVNFRGSSGYGLEFEALGMKEWARGIEDDIDAAVERVMKMPSIDPARICIAGASYGGFSAFASVVRHPDRYRCAVSTAGVTDVPLLGDSSDSADSESAIAFFRKAVGDFEKERPKLLEISPAYQAERIDVPVLIVQGTEDRRVDPDHAHRMALMLELFGKKFEMLEIEGAGHGFDRDEWIIEARALRRFLTTYLQPGDEFVPDPRSRFDG